MIKIVSIICALLLTGCSTTTIVTDAQGNESLNTLGVSCSTPYKLTQDCSNFSGATRTITLDGFEVNIAGSSDGKVVMVMDANLLKNSFSDIFTLNSKTHSDASNTSYHAVKKALSKHGITIFKALPMRLLGNTDGYVLELDSDGYKILLDGKTP